MVKIEKFLHSKLIICLKRHYCIYLFYARPFLFACNTHFVTNNEEGLILLIYMHIGYCWGIHEF